MAKQSGGTEGEGDQLGGDGRPNQGGLAPALASGRRGGRSSGGEKFNNFENDLKVSTVLYVCMNVCTNVNKKNTLQGDLHQGRKGWCGG